MLARALVIRKEEQLVLEDWTADRAANDVLRIGVSGCPIELVRPAVCIEIRIL